jgi:hypothetical protein
VLDQATLELTRVCKEHSSERVHFQFADHDGQKFNHDGQEYYYALHLETVYVERAASCHHAMGITTVTEAGSEEVKKLRCHDVQARILRRTSTSSTAILRQGGDQQEGGTGDDWDTTTSATTTSSEADNTTEGEIYTDDDVVAVTGRLSPLETII